MTLSIGSFAQLAGVSVRMLRHYDRIQLLAPARVDTASGRRTYDLDQLALLHRILALKGLGFTLQEVTAIVHQGLAPAEVHGMLRLRQAHLERQVHHHQHRLSRVAARLHLIEQEHHMSDTIHRKALAPLRLAGRVGTAPDATRATVGRLVEQLFTVVADRMDAVSGDRTDPIARFTAPARPEGTVQVTAGYVLTQGVVSDLAVLDWPAVEVAAVIHHGPVVNITAAYQALGWWAQANGQAGALQGGVWREVYLEASGEDQGDWIVEVQLEIAGA